MITDEVIKEIYKQFKREPKSREQLELSRYIDLLSQHHKICEDEDEIIVKNMEEFNPFRRFLIRSLRAILEFDQYVAFVFQNHILFFDKKSDNVHVNIKPPEESGFFKRLFGR